MYFFTEDGLAYTLNCVIISSNDGSWRVAAISSLVFSKSQSRQSRVNERTATLTPTWKETYTATLRLQFVACHFSRLFEWHLKLSHVVLDDFIQRFLRNRSHDSLRIAILKSPAILHRFHFGGSVNRCYARNTVCESGDAFARIWSSLTLMIM